LASQSGFPVHADPVHFSAEASFSYGLTEHWKLGFKSNLDDPVDEDLRVSTVGIENTFAHRGLTTGVGVAWFTGVDVAVHPDETNSVLFGPLMQFGTDKASVTLNPLFEKTFGRNHEPGVAFVYAWQAKAEVRELVALGVEGYGTIPDVGNAPGIDFQEHRIGPVLYLDFDLDRGKETPTPMSLKDADHKAKGDDEEGPKLALELGVLLGLTEATADTTVKFKAAATF
jgi:hypothetical protein